MKNNNQKAIRRLSERSLKSNRMRNTFAVMAIALTCMLFTALASMGIGMTQVAQEQTMREVGGKFHAGLKNATREQMEKVGKDPRVVSYTWN
ncbi:MAG: ABC transporter permease, partial [Lachnospiraceae bacterium]